MKAENTIYDMILFAGSIGSGDLRQMSEYPIPHGKHYHSCILKSAFLHPERELLICISAFEIQGLRDLAQG
jgi:hypothetical protein